MDNNKPDTEPIPPLNAHLLLLNAHLHRWRYIAVDVGDDMVFACVAAFDHPAGGLVWVEPHYIEPGATRSAAHGQAGRLRWGKAAATLTGGKNTLVLREPAGADEQWIIRATDAWQRLAHKAGRGRTAEREWGCDRKCAT